MRIFVEENASSNSYSLITRPLEGQVETTSTQLSALDQVQNTSLFEACFLHRGKHANSLTRCDSGLSNLALSLFQKFLRTGNMSRTTCAKNFCLGEKVHPGCLWKKYEKRPLPQTYGISLPLEKTGPKLMDTRH